MSRPATGKVPGQVPYARGIPQRHIAVLATRPDVLRLVVEYNPECPWGHFIEFEGTRDELIGAGVAHPEMFGKLGAEWVNSGPDEFGCKFTVERYRGDRFRVMRFLMECPCYGDLADNPQDWPAALREAAPAIGRLVGDLLARIGTKQE